MAPVAIVTDSTHYMPAELVRAQGIHEVSLYVNWGDQPERELDLPGFDSFYERLKAGREFPTTSQPSVGDYLEVYEPLIEQGSDIVSIHISGGISGTVGAAAQAKELLEERGARDRIDVFDAQTAAGGLGAVVLAAAALAGAGGDLAAVGARAREAREAVEIWFCVDTLEYLQRGGRVGKAQAWIGGALKVKPILTLGELITPVERVRTAGRAFDRMLQYMESLKSAGLDGWIVQHIQAPAQAQRLVAHGRELFGSEPAVRIRGRAGAGRLHGPGDAGRRWPAAAAAGGLASEWCLARLRGAGFVGPRSLASRTTRLGSSLPTRCAHRATRSATTPQRSPIAISASCAGLRSVVPRTTTSSSTRPTSTTR